MMVWPICRSIAALFEPIPFLKGARVTNAPRFDDPALLMQLANDKGRSVDRRNLVERC